MTSKANATDFGNLSAAKAAGAAFSSSTRGVFAAGSTGSLVNVIEYITIANTGNGTDFGDTSAAAGTSSGLSSTTRGVIALGNTGSYVDTMEYVTIGSTGNTTDFGNLSVTRGQGMGSCCNILWACRGRKHNKRIIWWG